MNFPSVNYKEPETSSLPQSPINLEVLKSGMILDNLEFTTCTILFGRLPNCDVVLDHPSSSRYHCMFQHMENNWFIYDLESAHGTFLNKKRISSKSYVQVYNGDMVKFGASSRLYIIHGAKERVLQENKVEKSKTVLAQEFLEDIDDDNQMKLHGKTIPVAIYSKDPKGVLSNWFDQQGYDLNIEFSQVVIQGDHGFIATLQMPVELLSFEAQGKGGKKKEAEIDVCLVACRKLDEKGLLVDTEAVLTEAEKRKIRNQVSFII